MNTNLAATTIIFNQIKQYFDYKKDIFADGTRVTIGSDRVVNTSINWETVGVYKGDRIVIVEGENTFTSYAKETPSCGYLELEDELTFTAANASITMYYLPVLFKEYAAEQVDMPYNVLTFIGRNDQMVYPTGRLSNITFQINLYDDNSNDEDIENISDEYIRIFDRLSVCGIEDEFAVVFLRFEIDSGIKQNKDFVNSKVILEKAVSFKMIITQL